MRYSQRQRSVCCRSEPLEPSDSMPITDVHFLARSSFRNLPAIMAFWRLDRRVLWRSSNSIRGSFREERGGLRASKERFDSAPPTRKGRSESRPHACARTNFPTLVATDARSPSLFGIRLPGYCLPLLFHKLLTVHRFLEASDTVGGESASHGRVGPHQCSEPERCVARPFWSRQRDAKRLNTCSPVLATSQSVSCACAAPASASAARAAGRRLFCGHLTSSLPSASSSVGASQP